MNNNQFKRQEDILELIRGLDITLTMHKNAEEKYQALAQYLIDHGIDAEIYPQGSFALGTVVRPIAKDPNASYDLDAICQVKKSRNNTSPKELRDEVEDILRNSNLYGGKLEVNEECLTIRYADTNGVSFSIDIVPAAHEGHEEIITLKAIGKYPELVDTAIVIPKHFVSDTYRWLPSNPKGYKEWFDGINKPFIAAVEREQRQRIFEQNMLVMDSIEDVPMTLVKSSVQRVIQLLKYHRDVYYMRLGKDEIKPISAIISTIVAKVAENCGNHSVTTFDLIKMVLIELDTYSEYQTIAEKDFRALYENKRIITREERKWILLNPANPSDNLADKWNEDADIPCTFFSWARAAYMDMIDSLNKEDDTFISRMDNAFNESVVKKSWGNRYRQTSTPINNISPTYTPKPWRQNW